MDVRKEYKHEIEIVASKILLEFKKLHKELGTDAFIEEVHSTVKITLDRLGVWEKASCSNGCSFCCHDRIDMSILESQYISNKLSQLNIKGDEVRKRLQQELPKESLNFMARACPMLLDENEEGKRLCSIYDFRPLVCITHNASTDPKYCNRVEHAGYYTKEAIVIEIEGIRIALSMLDRDLGLTKGKFYESMHNI